MLSMSQDQISELLLLIGRSAQFVFKIPLFYGGGGGGKWAESYSGPHAFIKYWGGLRNPGPLLPSLLILTSLVFMLFWQ
jgi:hypothetical protein